MVDLKEFVEQLVNFIVKEVNELVIILKEEYGIEFVVVVVVVVVGGGVVEGGVVVEEKIEFDVILKFVGVGKLKVVKEVKGLFGVGLKEVKELVDGVFGIIKEGVFKEEVEKIKEVLEGVGVEVELK